LTSVITGSVQFLGTYFDGRVEGGKYFGKHHKIESQEYQGEPGNLSEIGSGVELRHERNRRVPGGSRMGSRVKKEA
jgi:hypothetical protein